MKVRGSDNNRVVVKSRDFDDRRGNGRFDDDDRFDRRFAGNGLINGCPPGLAKKHQRLPAPGAGEEADRHALARSH